MSLGFCLVTTKTWSDDSKDPLGVSQPCHSFQASNGPYYSSQTNRCYSSVFQLCFIWMIAGNSIFEVNGHVNQRRKEKSAPARGGERERQSAGVRACVGVRAGARAIWLLFLYGFFSSPQACLVQIGLSQECSSTWSPHSVLRPSFDLLLFYFPGFSLPWLLATAILDSCFLF